MRSVQKYVWILLLLFGLQSMVSAAVWTVSPWTDDASTGIDSAKTYTHALNQSYQTAPVVNGVLFDLCWGGFENGDWDGNEGVDWDDDNNFPDPSPSKELSRDFRYNKTWMILNNLTPGGVYELTFFSVGWNDPGTGDRIVTLTDTYGSFEFDQEMYGKDNGIKIVGIYSADANGELHLGLTSNFHIYAFANCEYTGDLPVVVAPIAPDNFEGGNRVETDTVLEWAEEFAGSLTSPGFDVYMDPNEAKVTAMDPATLVSSKQSTFSYDPDLDPNALYYWRVAIYLDMADTEPNKVTDVRNFRTVYVDEHWFGSSWTDDDTSEISAGKTYTHKVNFHAPEVFSTTVNGVVFENDDTHSGANWTLAGAPYGADGGHHVTGDGGALVTNMFHGADAVLTLTGLTPGTDYILTKYTRGWGPTDGRLTHFITSADGRTTTLDGNLEGDGNGHLFKYAYTAPASGELVVTFDPLNPADTWHHYAFSNEVDLPVYLDPTPVPGANVNSDVELSWELIGDATSPTYNLKVSENSDMSSPVVDESGLAITSHTPYLSSDTIYYWQVEIVEDSAVIYTSPVWNFVTTPPQDATKVIEWKFDETTGTIAEQTGPTEDADGILIGFNDPNAVPSVCHVEGLVNNGLLLNGKDEYVDVNNAYVYMPTADGQSFAISGYIRTFDKYGPLFSMRNASDENPIIDIALGADGTQDLQGRICLLVRADTGGHANTNSGITVNDGRWHSVIVTRFEGNWKLYVDGVLRGTITNAATGSLTLDLMGIGASPRWLMDDWNNGRTYYRYFQGIMDEFTVWDGQLQPGQIAALAAALPPQGDVDFDLDTDIDDLTDFTADWLNDTMIAVQSSPVVLEDMESYNNDPNSYKAYWAEAEPDGYEYGTIDLSIVPDPNDSGNQVMQMDYTFTDEVFAHLPFRLLDRRVNSSLYDQLTIRVKKLAGSEPSEMILDFYDGRDNVDPLVEGLHSKGRIVFNFADVAEDEWTTLEAVLTENEIQFESCTDLYQIMVSIGHGTTDTGTLLIDSIELTDATEDCVATVGEMVPDMNGDCFVDMVDFAEIAEGWLNGI